MPSWDEKTYWDDRTRQWRPLEDRDDACERCLAVIGYYDEKHGVEDCIKSLAERSRPQE